MLKEHANFDAISLSKVIFITPFENEMSRSGKCVLKLFKDLCSIFVRDVTFGFSLFASFSFHFILFF